MYLAVGKVNSESLYIFACRKSIEYEMELYT